MLLVTESQLSNKAMKISTTEEGPSSEDSCILVSDPEPSEFVQSINSRTYVHVSYFLLITFNSAVCSSDTLVWPT